MRTLITLLSSLLLTACGSGSSSTPAVKVEPKVRMQPDIFSNSRGAVVANKDTFPYENVEFTLKGENFKTYYVYRVTKIAPGERLGLRWEKFKDTENRAIPKIIRPELLFMKVVRNNGTKLDTAVLIGN